MMTGADFSSTLPAPPQCSSQTHSHTHPQQHPLVPLPPSPALPSEAGFHQASAYNGAGPPLCRGCSRPIMDQFIIQVQGHMWHARCLRCAACQVTLTHTCYAGNNQMYCQEDFYRLFGAQCASCKNAIPPTEVVRFAHDNNIYHLDCFRCSGCGCLFDTGDQFYLSNDGRLVCQADLGTAKGRGQDENSNPDHSNPAALLEYYQLDPSPGREAIDKLARGVGLEPGHVRSWFRSQRAKDRRKGNNPGNSHPTLNANRVTAPPGGYPLPIVNKARSPGRLPRSANLPIDTAHMSINHARGSAHLSVWEELWSNDFVPPNVDLHPDLLKNGEVVRLMAPPLSHSHPLGHAHSHVLPHSHPSSGAQGHQPSPSSLIQTCGMANGGHSHGLGGRAVAGVGGASGGVSVSLGGGGGASMDWGS